MLMNNKKVYIHIGTPKTGSTYIQRYFANHREKLLDSGVLYPESLERFPGMRVGNHARLSAACSHLKKSKHLAMKFGVKNEADQNCFYQKVKLELENEINNHEINEIFCSNEHLTVQMFDNEGMIKLKNLFSSFSSDIKILVYLRRQDLVTVSSYVQKLKSGYTKELNLSELPNEWKDYYKLIKSWESVFGENNVIPRIFSQETMINGDIIEDLVNSLQFDNSFVSYERGERVNESLDQTQCNLLLSFNKLVDKKELRDNDVISFRNQLIESMAPNTDKNDFIKCNSTDVKSFMKDYDDSNSLLFSEYFPELGNDYFRSGS